MKRKFTDPSFRPQRCRRLFFLLPALLGLLFLTPTANAQTWSQIGANVFGAVATDGAEVKVAISADGNRMAVGRPYGSSGAGYVRMYQWNGSAWIQMGSDINGEAGFDTFGYSVSLSADGSRVAIGARGNDGNGTDAGHTRIYEWNGSAWVQVGSDIDGEAASDLSGVSVSISANGNMVAIGANGNDANGSISGHVRIYQWNGSAWVQQGGDIDGEAANDASGISISLAANGSRVAIGAQLNDGNGSNSGHVRIYQWNGSAWVQVGSDIDGEAANDFSGASVSLTSDGNRIAIGAPSNNNAGHVRVYQWNGSAWVQVGSDIDGNPSSSLGASVSISSDGSRVAIGTPSAEPNGDCSGAVRVYQWDGSAWTQQGSDINGSAGNRLGQSVSLAANGLRLAVGASEINGCDDSDITGSGFAQVYRGCAPLMTGVVVTETSGPTANDAVICNGDPATLTAGGGGVGGTYLWNTTAATQAITVSPATSTTYTVTVTDANGCTGTATQTITVIPKPVQVADQTICRNGAPVDLQALAPTATSFSGPGVTGTVFDPSAVPTNVNNTFVTVEYPCPFAGTIQTTAQIRFTITNPPRAALQDIVSTCLAPGAKYNLESLFNGSNTGGGTFTIVPALPLTNGKEITVPAAGGCFQVTYTVAGTGVCTGSATSTAQLLLVTQPNPSFTLNSSSPSPVCSDGAAVSVTLTRTSSGPNPVLTINGQPASFGTIMLPAPASQGSITYTICLKETNSAPAACGSLPGTNYEPCTREICVNFTVFNDGTNCGVGAPFASECAPGSSGLEVCTADISPGIDLGCDALGFSINTGDVIDATVTGPGVTFCSTETIEVCYEGNRADITGGQGGGQTLADLDPTIGILCDIITFEICIPFTGPCFDPIDLGPLEDLCTKTLTELVIDAVGAISKNSGGGQVVADTDGDGAFDMVLDQYDFPVDDCVNVPNNVTSPGGVITVRNVVGFPNPAVSTCGVLAPDAADLLDILPLGALPLVGPIIEDLLATFGCNIPLQMTDAADLRIPVINNQSPTFPNCNPAGYVFYENGACTTPANWSIPVVYDACFGSPLNYRGRTAGTDATFYNGTAPAVVSATQSGVYQTGGPIIGSELPVGTYTVTYTAYSCAGIASTCSFPVQILAGTPVLECPGDVVLRNDIDQCDAVATGLAPLQGISCNSIINYSVDYPAAAATQGFADVATNTAFSPANLGTHNDVSGLTFPVGTSTVTYTLLVDINGDGDVADAGETQTCAFDVIIVDAQKPNAVCRDITVQLDNTGSVTIYPTVAGGANFIDGGSTDNCSAPLTIQIAEGNLNFGNAINFDCEDVGIRYVNLRVTDGAGNSSICLSNVTVEDFLGNIQVEMDLPELCLEANNPVQLDFNNYTNLTLPNGNTIRPSQVASNAYLGDVTGFFAISSFAPHPGSPSVDPGSITPEGVYTPGTGTGYVTISYILLLPGSNVGQVGANSLAHCFQIFHTTFELRQPLDMASPECVCVDEDERIVDLGVISGGLEPYTIQYTGVRLDVNGDGIEEDADGEYTYDVANGHNINDFQQDLGELRVVYTQPVWSFKIVDARGCELFRSGSCDNDDDTEGPAITCPPSNNTLTTEPYLCESQYEWRHPLPTDNCAVVQYDYTITNPDGTIEGPFNLNTLLNVPQNSAYFEAEYEFQLGVSIISYHAADAQGNSITCTFQITVSDDDPPYFINCPYPPVVQNAETQLCDAYVDFALPLAQDNCDIPLVRQIDNTGLTTGKRFPVGTTIMYWEAIDLAGNRDTCQVKVIVNDFFPDPVLTCPANVVQNNDFWLCGAVVNNIAPVTAGSCQKNYGITYEIFADAALTQRKDCGVNNASGEFFDVGDSWVRYTVQSQPLLMITEVTQSGGVDRLEIANLGPADIDISCLEIKRVSGNPAANETLGPVTLLPSLAPSILPVGGVRVFNFTFNGAAGMPACYTISYMGTVFDQVATNGFAGCNGFAGTLASGDVIRKCEADTDNAADWVVAENCNPLTIGTMNPDLEVMPDNGTQTSLQSIFPNKVDCTFKVTIRDAENPFCGKLSATTTTYNGAAIAAISPATCNRSTITVPAGNCIIGDIVFNRTGTASPANSTMTLISPKGIKVVITELPDDSLRTLFGQKAEGVWTLDVVPNPGQTPTLTGWSLSIKCIENFNLPDQLLNNAPGQCGQNFTWIHPYFVDNCFEGSIKVAYSSSDADCVPAGSTLLDIGGYSNTQFFCVGTTKVTYTLTDAAGNVSQCDFDVTVRDIELPVVVCPQNITIHLNGGECGAYVSYGPLSATDNCAVVDTLITPPSGSWFDIGTHVVTIRVTDESGNTRTCTFNVNIIEFDPPTNELVCNDLTNVSLDASCVYTIDVDGALEGNNYHCYEDYVVSVRNSSGQIVSNTFNASNIGQTFTVTVIDTETGNSCWTTMKIEDKLVPALTCPANITIACSQPTTLAVTGNVQIQDCSPTATVIDNNVLDNGECGNPRQVITRSFIVTDNRGNQNSCQQTITVAPFNLANVVFPADITINCENVYLNPAATEPNATGRPSINGAPVGQGSICSASIGYTDERLDVCEGSYSILRTWRVSNECLPLGPNNPVSYVQRIRVRDIGGPQFVCPPAVTVSTDPFNCCATAALPDMIVSEGCSFISDLKAKVTGTNPANGNIITFTVPGSLHDFPSNNIWNPDTLARFAYTQCLPIGDYNVEYSAADQCGNLSKCNFVLSVADLIPPTTTCTQVTKVSIINNGEVIVDATVFDQGTTDNCCLAAPLVRRMVDGPCDNDTEEDAFTSNIKFCCADLGDTVMVVFRAFDCYGNYNDCMVNVLVEDKLKPVCTPPANVTVNCEAFDPSLWTYGIPTVLDNCCLDDTRVYQGQIGLTHSASYTQFDTVCNRGTITRTFRAFDCNGQSSQCTQRVVVTYEQDYFVRFPNDVIVTVCNSSGVYGTPTFFGENCELLATSYTDELFTVVPDACYKIERAWKVINWCTYNPNLPCTNVPNPNPNAITNSPQNLPGPIVSPAGTVAPWAPTVVSITPGAPATNYSTFWTADVNCYEYKQIIKIIDNEAPVAECPISPVEFCDLTTNNGGLWNEMYYWDNRTEQHDLCEGPSDLTLTATDACSGANINIEYLLFLDLDGNGSMETVVNSQNLPGFNRVNYNNAGNPNFSGGTAYAFDERAVPGNQKYGFTIQKVKQGNNLVANVRWNTAQSPTSYVVPELPYGTHKIKWLITDGCGNNKECEYTFVVKDCKKPTVVCLNGLSVNIMQTGMVSLWASDFLQYTEDNCTPTPKLKIGIVRSEASTGSFPVDGNGNPLTEVQFNCDDTDLDPELVQLWSIDLAGNADFCETYVLVQDNMGNCGGPKPSVAGYLKTEGQQGLEEAEVDLQGSHPAVPPVSLFENSDQNGKYEFSNAVPVASNVTITPLEDDNHINGVSTFDLVLISKHILGIEPLTSPYKMIAADANKSGSITTFDIVELRKLILGVYTELPNNTSWRFVDKAYSFPNPSNPFANVFPENKTIAEISTSMLSEDFVSVKVGDLNGNAVANSFMQSEDRSAGTLYLNTEDRDIKAGETFEISLSATQNVQGYQLTLNHAGLEILDVTGIKSENFAVHADAVTLSVDGSQTAATITLKVRAMQSGKLSRMLGVSSRITKAEAYNAASEKLDIALRYNNSAVITGLPFELYQNVPNPFISKTSIGFHLPEAATATLKVYDESGRVLLTQKGDFAKGYNQFSLDRQLLNTTGLLYYTVETATDKGTKLMIQAK